MDLDEMFEKYDQKNNKKEEAYQEKNEVVAKAKDAGLEILKQSVEPVLEKISNQINSKGYKAEIKTGYECVLHPRIEMQIHIASKGQGQAYLSTSKIGFRHLEGDKIKVTREVNSRNGKADSHTPGAHDLTPSHNTVTTDWVEKITLELIQAALDAN